MPKQAAVCKVGFMQTATRLNRLGIMLAELSRSERLLCDDADGVPLKSSQIFVIADLDLVIQGSLWAMGSQKRATLPGGRLCCAMSSD
jgi:hypothetical protein